jgi:hypothetical protein
MSLAPTRYLGTAGWRAMLVAVLLVPGPARALQVSPLVVVQLVAHVAPGARLDTAPGASGESWDDQLRGSRMWVNTAYTVTVRHAGSRASAVLLESSESGRVSWDRLLERLAAARFGAGAEPGDWLLEVRLRPRL